MIFTLWAVNETNMTKKTVAMQETKPAAYPPYLQAKCYPALIWTFLISIISVVVLI